MSNPKVLPRILVALWRRLLQLDQPVPNRTESQIVVEVEQNFRWNFVVNLLDGVTFWFGFSFVSSSTIIPLFVSKLTPNPLLIGLVAVIAQSGWYIPQIFTAGLIEKLPRKKPVVVNLGYFLERFPLWFWPLAALLTARSPTLALIVFFVSYGWHGLGAGMIAPAWQDLIARCFPVDRRGRFFGTSLFIGSGVATLAATLSSWLLRSFAFPVNFMYIFLIGALAMNFSVIFLALTREPVLTAALAPHANTPFGSRLKKIVRQDNNFRRFLQVRVLMAFGTMAVGFLTVAAIQRWQVPDSIVGIFTVALLIGQTSSQLGAGILADRLGHKLALEMGCAAGFLAFFLAWVAPAVPWFYAAFALLGVSGGMILVSGTLITMEFSAPAQRPTYIGIANTAVGIANAIAPLVGGWLASFDYNWVFVGSAGFNLLALILMRWYVEDPRQLVQKPVT